MNGPGEGRGFPRAGCPRWRSEGRMPRGWRGEGGPKKAAYPRLALGLLPPAPRGRNIGPSVATGRPGRAEGCRITVDRMRGSQAGDTHRKTPSAVEKLRRTAIIKHACPDRLRVAIARSRA